MTSECFKCAGNGHFVAYSHILNGTCFQCGGTGVCDTRAFSQVAPNGPVKPSRTIETAHGRCTIARWGREFKATWSFGEVYFSVVRDEVIVSIVSDGVRDVRGRGKKLQAALQAALKKTH